MKYITLILVVFSMIGFSSCGKPRTNSKKKTTSALLSAKNASTITPSAAMVGLYQSYSGNSIYSNIIIKSTGQIFVSSSGASTEEKLGKDASGNYYITDTIRNTVYLITLNEQSLTLYRSDGDNYSSAQQDIFYKLEL